MSFRAGFIAALTLIAFASSATAAVVRYNLTVTNTWSVATHPNFPARGHFSFLGGATHKAGTSFWSVGSLATPGIKKMAESGDINRLEPEVQAAIDAGMAGSFLGYEQWFCPPSVSEPRCEPSTVSFEIDESNPLVTLASMLGPTPDWFIGVDSLELFQGGMWLDNVVVELFPFDGGTLTGNEFRLFTGEENDPPEPISHITDDTGQIIGGGSLGTFTFTRVSVVPIPPALPLFLAALGALLTMMVFRKTSWEMVRH
jgi:Spondin_N